MNSCKECKYNHDKYCDSQSVCKLDIERIKEEAYKQGKADAIAEVMKMAKFNIHFENIAEEERFMQICEQMQEGAE